MAVRFRHGDPRYPFFWESSRQPAGRWHGSEEGPVQYLADTPDGAWAEFLRHEEITDPADLAGVRRRLWAVEIDLAQEQVGFSQLPAVVARGDQSSYEACQAHAREMRASGVTCLQAPSAALTNGSARGQRSSGGSLSEAGAADGAVWALFGIRPDARGWACVDVGAPTPRVLSLVRQFRDLSSTKSGQAAASPERRGGDDRRQTIELVRVERGEPERRVRQDRRQD